MLGNNLMKEKKVVIVGGGPVGLLMARLLQMKGIEVKVYERDAHEHSRCAGGTLDLGDSAGASAVEEAGLSDEFRKFSRVVGGRSYDTKGNFLEHVPIESLPQIDRKDLRSLLIESLKPDTIIWGKQYVSTKKIENDRNTVNFSDGTTVEADVIIAADGKGSKVRPLVSAVEPTYSGITIVNGVIENFAIQCPEMFAFCQPDDKINCLLIHDMVLFLQPRSNGTMDYYFACYQREEWSKDVTQFDPSDLVKVRAFLKERLKDWAPVYSTLLEPTSQFMALPQYT